MTGWIKFEWIFISWILSLFIHHHSVKRGAISAQKDALIDLLTSLSDFKWSNIEGEGLYEQERYNAQVSRVNWKLRQLNKLSSCKFIREKKLTPLYDFDIEVYLDKDTSIEDKEQLKFELQECCEDLIDEIENTHFDKIVSSKSYIFWSHRHTLFGILSGLAIVYLFIKTMSLFFK